MPIKKLKINKFRNIVSADFSVSPNFNIFYGQNGSGKTSILEAIYYLGYNRSFRTHQSNLIIQHQAENFLLFAELNENSQTIPIGIERGKNGDKKIKIDGETITNLASLVRYLPLQLIDTESYQLFHEGPKRRRRFLDWGVFHVEHSFYSAWQKLQHCLKQRNSSLKLKLSQKEVSSWDAEFCLAANEMHQQRDMYVRELTPILDELFLKLLPKYKFDLRYLPGWDTSQELSAILIKYLPRDYQFGYTQCGPQRADLQLLLQGTPAQEILSQGQLKLASYALLLAQGILMANKTGKSPIYLIDDLPSELDAGNRSFIIQVLEKLQAQVFVTGIDQKDLQLFMDFPHSKMFHVEHGGVKTIYD